MQHKGVRLRIKGQVQGVGFRPYIWQLAQEFGLSGEVYNDANGVVVKLNQHANVAPFIAAIAPRKPKLASVDSIVQCDIEIAPYQDFSITSSKAGTMDTNIVPDAATCEHCKDDILTPQNRRHDYAFTNCIHCGPRFSIIKSIPYDRSSTSMATFAMCDECLHEYQNPINRRFHAQPNACPKCGPTLRVCDAQGNNVTNVVAQSDPITWCVQQLKLGQIIAIKGLGGFHLAANATDEKAIACLRERKQRKSKPFAVMVKSIEAIKALAFVDEEQEKQLLSTAAPIVLLKPKANSILANNVAFDVPYIGVMLPSNPLQLLLLEQINTPLIMTSGNQSGFPPAMNNQHAIEQLRGLCDYFMLHNRDIVRRVDDSIVQVVNNLATVLRRARGFVPQALTLPIGFEHCDGVLALGSDLKNSACFIKQGKALLTPYLGDVSNPLIFDQLQQTVTDFSQLFSLQTTLGSYDKHSGYLTHQYAQQLFAQVNHRGVNHHHAHIAACMADNGIERHHEPMLAVTLDGLGWNDAKQSERSHHLFGGEIFIANYSDCQHVTGLEPMAMVGGDKASKQPWRNLFVYLTHYVPDWQQAINKTDTTSCLQALSVKPTTLLEQAIMNNINSPVASSTGRLFDAVAALLTPVFEEQSFEGEAAMSLEALAWQSFSPQVFDFTDLKRQYPQPSMVQLWQQLFGYQQRNELSEGALFFHRYLAHLVLYWLSQSRSLVTNDKVVLTGGVMQNSLLLPLLVQGLQQQNQTALIHHLVPANDGGIALGQALVAWCQESVLERP